MNIHSILAITDFSTEAEHGLDRAAMLSVVHQAKLQVMYFAEYPHPGLSDPLARLAQRARQLARRHGIDVTPVSRNSDSLDDVVAQSNGAEACRKSSHWYVQVAIKVAADCACFIRVGGIDRD